MKLLSPTQHKRLNEVTGFLLLSLGLVIAVEPGFVPLPGPFVGHGRRFAPSQPGGLPGRVAFRRASANLRRRGVSLPAAGFPAVVEMDPLGGTGRRRGEDLRRGAAYPGCVRRALFRAAAPVRRHDSPGRDAGAGPGELPGGFAEPGRRAAGHGHRGGGLRLPGFHLHAGPAGRVVRGSHGLVPRTARTVAETAREARRRR